MAPKVQQTRANVENPGRTYYYAANVAEWLLFVSDQSRELLGQTWFPL